MYNKKTNKKSLLELTVVNSIAFKINKFMWLSILGPVVAKNRLKLGDLCQSEEPQAPLLELGITRTVEVPDAYIQHAHITSHHQ